MGGMLFFPPCRMGYFFLRDYLYRTVPKRDKPTIAVKHFKTDFTLLT
jgi:hypothetical protein